MKKKLHLITEKIWYLLLFCKGNLPSYNQSKTNTIISIFHWCMVWTEKSVMRVADRHHEASQLMPNSDPE